MTNPAEDPRHHLDGILHAITTTLHEQLADPANRDNANSTYLAAIASTLTTIGRTLANINDALHAPQQPPAGTCTAIIDTGFGAPTYEGCNYPHGHTGAHRSTRNGDIRWTDTSPDAGHLDAPPHQHAGQCDTTEGTRRCLFTTGHPGEHAYRTRHADRCTGNTPGLDNCALDTSHTPPCTDWNGHPIP